MGFSELIVLGIIVMVLIGPKQLPEIIRGFGNLMKEVKKARNEFTGGIERDDDFRNMRDSIQDVKQTVDGHVGSVRSSLQADFEKMVNEHTKSAAAEVKKTPDEEPHG